MVADSRTGKRKLIYDDSNDVVKDYRSAMTTNEIDIYRIMVHVQQIDMRI